MGSKIFASLKDGSQVILFDENSKYYEDIAELFEYDVEKFEPISFIDNIRSTLKDDEIYFIKISEDEEKKYFSNIKLDINSVNHNIAEESDYSKMEVIYLVNTDDNSVRLKKIYAMKRIVAKKVLGYGDFGPTYKKESNKIDLSPKVNVYYDINKKTFYFKNFNHLKAIFKDTIEFYRNASKKEIIDYFPKDVFELDESKLDSISNTLRKRLGILIDKEIDFFDKELMEKYEAYAEEHGIKIYKNEENGKYKLDKKTRLENFVKILEEVIYETPVSKEKREVDNYRNLQKDE